MSNDITLGDIAEHLDERYNAAMSVYEYEAFVRLTNGSGGAMVDLRPVEDGIELCGRWYDTGVDRVVDADFDAVDAALGRVI
jgi:hypothetical protein